MKPYPNHFTRHSQNPDYWDRCPKCGEPQTQRTIHMSESSATCLVLLALLVLLMAAI